MNNSPSDTLCPTAKAGEQAQKQEPPHPDVKPVKIESTSSPTATSSSTSDICTHRRKKCKTCKKCLNKCCKCPPPILEKCPPLRRTSRPRKTNYVTDYVYERIGDLPKYTPKYLFSPQKYTNAKKPARLPKRPIGTRHRVSRFESLEEMDAEEDAVIEDSWIPPADKTKLIALFKHLGMEMPKSHASFVKLMKDMGRVQTRSAVIVASLLVEKVLQITHPRDMGGLLGALLKDKTFREKFGLDAVVKDVAKELEEKSAKRVRRRKKKDPSSESDNKPCEACSASSEPRKKKQKTGQNKASHSDSDQDIDSSPVIEAGSVTGWRPYKLPPPPPPTSAPPDVEEETDQCPQPPGSTDSEYSSSSRTKRWKRRDSSTRDRAMNKEDLVFGNTFADANPGPSSDHDLDPNSALNPVSNLNFDPNLNPSRSPDIEMSSSHLASKSARTWIDWTEDEVLEWLKRFPFGESYVRVFRERNVNGIVLPTLSVQMLERIFDMKYAHILKFRRAVQRLTGKDMTEDG